MPFLRLTRDRRGFEHTCLLHADLPGERPRVLYWYRTAPDVLIGRPALDEEAIRLIEEQHPNIDFDWPAILALKDAMTPEEEPATARRAPGRRMRPGRRETSGPRPAAPGPSDPPEPRAADDENGEPDGIPTTHGLLEELVGREIATRLRGRYAEIRARILEQPFDARTREDWLAQAEALDPDAWLTPESVLQGVSLADSRFDDLRRRLLERPGA